MGKEWTGKWCTPMNHALIIRKGKPDRVCMRGLKPFQKAKPEFKERVDALPEGTVVPQEMLLYPVSCKRCAYVIGNIGSGNKIGLKRPGKAPKIPQTPDTKAILESMKEPQTIKVEVEMASSPELRQLVASLTVLTTTLGDLTRELATLVK
jgi:hypothetical protein